MKRKIFIICVVLTFCLGLYLASQITVQDCFNCRKEIEAHSFYEKISTQETYPEDCALEDSSHIFFPLAKPAYAILHFDRLFKLPKRLTPGQTERILRIVNDSASYIWGELGTPYFDRFITFHDSNDHPIGILQLSFEGQAYCTPHLARMKWGMLANSDIMTIISE